MAKSKDCCKGHFPTFWVIILLLAVVWFLKELGLIQFNFPWLPTIVVIVAIGGIVNHCCRK